jgi:hypothetical protein
MPKESEFEQTIPKLYRRKYEDIAMLFWVEAQMKLLPTLTLDQALTAYFKHIGCQYFDISCERVKLSRLRSEFIDLRYEASKKNRGLTK